MNAVAAVADGVVPMLVVRRSRSAAFSPVAHKGGAHMTALAQPRSWRAQLLATPASHRRRLPSDVVGALLGAATAAAGWLAVAAGVDTPVAPHLGPAVSWLVTLVAVGGTSVFLGVTALVCALAGRWAHVPKVRRLAAARLQPRLAPAWRNVRNLLNDPGQLGRLLAGAALTQLLLATGLWFALHAVGASASFGSLIIVCTASSLLGGIAPVPGGMGVVEASYISLLTLLGIPEDLAIATTLLYRLCTTYLPPIWGWGALVWLRRHDEL